jgi:hypothetical protein
MLHATLVIALIGRLSAMPVAYWVLWFASLAVSITLVTLLRTRFGNSRPLHKCAVLSLLVHVMLAWAAMTVRIVAGDGNGDDGGMGPSIRVRVISDAVEGPFLVDTELEAPPIDEAPPLLEPPVKEKTSPLESQAKADEPAAKPPASATPAIEAKVETDPVSKPEEVVPTTADAPNVSDIAESVPTPESIALTPESGSTNQSETPASDEVVMGNVTSPPPTGNATAVAMHTPTAQKAMTPYSLRNSSGRLGLVEQQGGSGRTESAVSAALKWLAAAQSRDGRWDADEYGAGQEHMVLNQNRGGAGRNADTGVSGLALLAFLGAGHSHMHGDYQDTVRRGIDFLLRSQAADGSLFGDSTLYARMYCHGMAAFALAEAQAMTGDRRLEPAVIKAINYSIASQNSLTGGWRYRPGDIGDTSQLGWQVMALVSADRAGLEIPTSTWNRVERFLSTVRRGNAGGLASYRPDSPASTSMTAEALCCRLMLSDVHGTSIDEAAAEEATANVLGSLPAAERVNLYYWYYATLALHHRFQQNERAAEEWTTWNDAMTAAILATQVIDGHDAGSWNTNTIWGGYGGRIYTTAMAAMCLEVYYRYAPAPGQPARWTASRPQLQGAHE